MRQEQGFAGSVGRVQAPPVDYALATSQCAELAGAAHWYALTTRHQHEKAIAHHLQRMGFGVFLPLYCAAHQWKDRRKIVALPLFPCYVFISGDLERRFDILNLPGVGSLVTCGGKAAIIPVAELEFVRRLITSPLPAEGHPFVQCGDRVRVLAGPLAGVEGIVARRKNSLRIVLSVCALQQSVAVEIDESLVEPVPCA